MLDYLSFHSHLSFLSAAKFLVFYLRVNVFPRHVFHFYPATCGIHFPTLPFPCYSPFSLSSHLPAATTLSFSPFSVHFMFSFCIPFFQVILCSFPLTLVPSLPVARSPSFPCLRPALLLLSLPFSLFLSLACPLLFILQLDQFYASSFYPIFNILGRVFLFYPSPVCTSLPDVFFGHLCNNFG